MRRETLRLKVGVPRVKPISMKRCSGWSCSQVYFEYVTRFAGGIGMQTVRDCAFTTWVVERISVSVHGPQWPPCAASRTNVARSADAWYRHATASLAHTPLTEASRAVCPSSPTHNTSRSLFKAPRAPATSVNTATAAKILWMNVILIAKQFYATPISLCNPRFIPNGKHGQLQH